LIDFFDPKFLGIVGTVVALFYQIFNNNRQLKTQTFFHYTNRYQNIIMNLPIDIESETYDTNSIKDDHLIWFRAYFDLCSEEYYLYRNKMIDKKVWDLWKSGMETSLRKPAFKYAWEKIKNTGYFCKEFENFINGILNYNSKKSNN